MALELKIAFEGADSSGRVLTLHDDTGLYDATDNPGGWGSPNLDPASLTRLRVTVSPLFNRAILQQDFLPEDYDLETIVAGEQDMSLSSLTLGSSTPEMGLLAFNDGVYDFNYYAVFEPVTGVVANKGETIVTGPDMDVWYTYDSILIGEDLYTIDHSLPPFGNTVLPLVEPLKTDATSFNPAYRANVKGMVSEQGRCLLMANAGRIADECNCGKRDYLDAGVQSLMMRQAAILSFNDANYGQADAMLRGSVSTMRKKFGGCGC